MDSPSSRDTFKYFYLPTLLEIEKLLQEIADSDHAEDGGPICNHSENAQEALALLRKLRAEMAK